MKLGMQVGLGPGYIALDGDPAPPPLKAGRGPQISAQICCGQMAGWIKMPLRMEAGLGPGDFALDGDPAPSPQKGQSAQVRPLFIVAKQPGGSKWHLAWRWASVQPTLC